MFLDGFAISHYRSFGPDPQRFGPLAKINFLIGQNNSGKSNVLLWLTQHLGAFYEATRGRADKLTLDPLDRPSGLTDSEIAFEIGVRPSEEYLRQLPLNIKERPDLLETCLKILQSTTLTHGTPLAWFRYRKEQNSAFSLVFHPDAFLSESVLGYHELERLWSFLTNAGGGNQALWATQAIARLAPTHLKAPDVHLVPAIRRIGDPGSRPDDFSGVGIIDRLAELQNPTLDQQHMKLKFQRINAFLQTVTGDESAQLEIPHNRKTILVHMDDRTLPLSSLGTGIHEVVILAAAAVIIDHSFLCIEEPELHLHPLLQKLLVRHLESTTNRYVMTTHSAHLLDTPEAVIFHIQHVGGHSRVQLVSTDLERCVICSDLGYRPSDLLQSNCIIWVEGPSDRIYLNHWLHTAAPDLTEGLHYSIMFYGGRLLSHLSANDKDVDAFISLRRLNQYLSVIIDSDASSSTSALNNTKRRVCSEFDQGPGFAWVTAGREIENYIPDSILKPAVASVQAGAEQRIKTGRYRNCLTYGPKGKRVTVDKVKVASTVTASPADLAVLDLNEKLQRLVEFIRKANGA
jgi:hypothetical protein